MQRNWTNEPEIRPKMSPQNKILFATPFSVYITNFTQFYTTVSSNLTMVDNNKEAPWPCPAQSDGAFSNWLWREECNNLSRLPGHEVAGWSVPGRTMGWLKLRGYWYQFPLTEAYSWDQTKRMGSPVWARYLPHNLVWNNRCYDC